MSGNSERKYDLEERTAKFGESVITLCKKIRQDNISSPIINQLVRSSTSVGANYMEANGASSKRDFINKIFICKKELQETKHWLRMMISFLSIKDQTNLGSIQSECQELLMIFTKIANSSRRNMTS